MKVFLIYILVFIVWTGYRAVFWLPLWLEELVIKPIIFLTPVFLSLKKEPKKAEFLGLTGKVVKSIRLGISVGLFYGLLAFWFNYLKFGSFQLITFGLEPMTLVISLLLGLATAFSEEVFFHGFLLKKLIMQWQDEYLSVLLVGVLFALIHLPIVIFSAEQGRVTVLIQLFLTLLIGWGNGILRLRSQSIWPSILSHVFWGTTIFLFR
jgi:membrane protease YdiL (CAAX protease family)